MSSPEKKRPELVKEIENAQVPLKELMREVLVECLTLMLANKAQKNWKTLASIGKAEDMGPEDAQDTLQEKAGDPEYRRILKGMTFILGRLHRCLGNEASWKDTQIFFATDDKITRLARKYDISASDVHSQIHNVVIGKVLGQEITGYDALRAEFMLATHAEKLREEERKKRRGINGGDTTPPSSEAPPQS